jgi:hypothetical protein
VGPPPTWDKTAGSSPTSRSTSFPALRSCCRPHRRPGRASGWPAARRDTAYGRLLVAAIGNDVKNGQARPGPRTATTLRRARCTWSRVAFRVAKTLHLSWQIVILTLDLGRPSAGPLRIASLDVLG